MPITGWVVTKLRRSWDRGTGTRIAVVAALLFVAPFYALLGPLWFDLAYVVIRAAFGERFAGLRRSIAAAGVALLVVALLVATAQPVPQRLAAARSGSSDPSRATDGGIARGATPGATTRASNGQTPTAALSVAASPTPTPELPDEDDDAGTPPPEPPHGAVTGGGGIAETPAPSPGERLPGEPDPRLTPGALNPAVTQATIDSTICVANWTSTIRPSSSYTTKLKVQQIALYGYADTSTASYEEDHLIPLELGGAPSDPANLWPQPWYAYLADGRSSGARTKDAYENTLRKAVCAGSMTLAEAQTRIGAHWVHAYYGLPFAPGSATGTATPAATSRPTLAPTTGPTPPPVVAPTEPPAATANCDPSYPTVCIKPYPPDLNCSDIPYKNFKVLPPDPHRFDGDGDGIGCES